MWHARRLARRPFMLLVKHLNSGNARSRPLSVLADSWRPRSTVYSSFWSYVAAYIRHVSWHSAWGFPSIHAAGRRTARAEAPDRGAGEGGEGPRGRSCGCAFAATANGNAKAQRPTPDLVDLKCRICVRTWVLALEDMGAGSSASGGSSLRLYSSCTVGVTKTRVCFHEARTR